MAIEQLRLPEPDELGTPAGTAPLLLTIRETTALLSIGRSTLYELIAEGELETVHIGRSVRVPADAARSFVARLRRSQHRT